MALQRGGRKGPVQISLGKPLKVFYMEDSDFFREEVRKISEEDFSINLKRPPREVISAVQAILPTMDYHDPTAYDSIIDRSQLSMYAPLPTDVLDFLFDYTDGAKIAQDTEIVDMRPRLSCAVFHNDLSEDQLAKAVELYSPGLLKINSEAYTFKLAITGVLKNKLTPKVINGLYNNPPFLRNIINTDYFRKFFPDCTELINSFVCDLSNEDRSNKQGLLRTLIKNILSPSEIEFLIEILINKKPDSEFLSNGKRSLTYHLYDAFVKKVLSYQTIPYDTMRRIGLPDKICYFLAEKDSRVPIPEWTRKGDVTMVGANIPREYLDMAISSKSSSVTFWLALIGPVDILPLLIGKGVDILVEARIRGDDKKIGPLKASLIYKVLETTPLSNLLKDWINIRKNEKVQKIIEAIA